MKINKFFMGFGMAAALSLVACSSDEPTTGGSDNLPADGQTYAYMKVTLNDVNTVGSRATEGGFEYGSDDERDVNNANFYFYNDKGAYVTSATIWNKDGAGTTENVEFKGNTVLVLKDLVNTNMPKYIVTVLNKPEGFTPGATLTEMEAKLFSDPETSGNEECYKIKVKDKEYFTITTSSYNRGTAGNAYEYFTTPVSSDAFLQYTLGQTPTEEEINALKPVDIYVERLAVKVAIANTLKEYTKITVSMGNDINTDNNNTIPGGNIEGTIVNTPVADKDLYVKIEGWSLNNLAMNEYLMKNLVFGETDKGDDNFNWTGWDKTDYFRSYWAKAWTYNKGVYTDNSVIKHYSLNDVTSPCTVKDGEITNAVFKLNVGDNTYCPENTNKASVLKTGENLGSVATNAMIYARIYTKEGDTYIPATFVSFNGMIFTKDSYINLVLNSVNNNLTPNATKYAKKITNADGKTEFKSIEVTDIKMKAGNKTNKGEIIFELSDDAKSAAWYTYTGEMKQDEESFTASKAETVLNAINAMVASVGEAYCYNGGYMYYNVPIEHFGPGTADAYKEGFYGVVRNHKYQLTINSLNKLGNAIYDPDNVIIPDTPTKEQRFALGVRVNILSWKLVNQTVDL